MSKPHYDSITWLFFRYIRRPLVVIILAYAVAALGLSLTPGESVNGETQHLSLFHAFYVVSYTATTIGFGELPIIFSNAQRAWIIIVMHGTVIAWAYTIGSILSLLQNQTFRLTMARRRFTKQVHAINQPFYIICGYGEVGASLIHELIYRGYVAVILESDPERDNELVLQSFPVFIPHFCADASNIEVLKQGGLEHPYCAGVFALTDSDDINQRIMVMAQLCRPSLYTVCRCEDSRTAAVLEGAKVNLIIDAFALFARRMYVAISKPKLFSLIELLQRGKTQNIDYLQGRWLMIGFGRFGKILIKAMQKAGLEVIPIDVDAKAIENEPHGLLSHEIDDEAWRETWHSLVHNANGVVLSTNLDSNNISLLIDARSINKKIRTIVRQNRYHNNELFMRLNADIVMDPRQIIVEEILSHLTVPLLGEFFNTIENESNEFSGMMLRLIQRTLVKVNEPLHVWTIEINKRKAPAATTLLSQEVTLEVRHLIRKAHKDEDQLYGFPLLLAHHQERHLAPAFDFPLQYRDRILWVGHRDEEIRQLRILQNIPLLEMEVFHREQTHSSLIKTFYQWFQRSHSTETQGSSDT